MIQSILDRLMESGTPFAIAGGAAAGLIFLGLDYTACDIVLRRYHAAPHVFEDLQAMEDAALAILNEAD